MNKLKDEYIEKIYAGWLAKIIGIRLGAPIEGWTYEKIKNVYGELDCYPVDYKRFAADDDSNGPAFFVRALEDGGEGANLTSKAVGDALLNYAPYERGFFWWGGYGVSTEHTAYLNLRNGVAAPWSGSMAQNGRVVAEQIGGQIFIDCWGLVCPGNPDLASKLAEAAAGVTHDGNGIYGGVFVAACISSAFEEKSIPAIIEKGLSYIPKNCGYARVAGAVRDFYAEHPDDWRACFKYVFDNFGYDKYAGNCHIIPNTAVMILALLYGGGDFDRTLNICNMCGWDTDCNVGNVATIMGVAAGLEGINYQKWRKPINDFLACSSVVGSLNITDIPSGAAYFVKQAWALAGEELPEPWRSITTSRLDSCHFEFPGSTHALEARGSNTASPCSVSLTNSDETAATGSRSLKIHAMPLSAGERVFVYKRTYLYPEDFHDSRYDPGFSPLVYPGQIIRAAVFLPEYGNACSARLYARDAGTGVIHEGEAVHLPKGEWVSLSYAIPPLPGGLIDEMGIAFDMHKTLDRRADLCCFIDDLYVDGSPDYSVDFSAAKEDVWNSIHREIRQFTKLKGLSFLQDGMLHLSCSDFAEMYTGRHDWTDYTAAFTLVPCVGDHHFVNFRVGGAIRSYAAGFSDDKLCLLKNENGYRVLCETDFEWSEGEEYEIAVTAENNRLSVAVNGRQLLSYTDADKPYLRGAIGVSVQKGSHCSYSEIRVKPVR